MRAPPPALLLSLAALFWSGNFVLGRAVHAAIPPIGLNFWRWVVAAAVLFAIAGFPDRAERAALWRRRGLVLALATAGIAGFNSFAYTALHTTTAINAVVVLAAIPMFIPLVAWALDRARIGARQAVGIVLSSLGVLAVVARGDVGALATLEAAPGDLWMLAAVASWSVYSVLLKRVPAEVRPLRLLAVLAAVGVVLLAPFYGWETARTGGFAVDAAALASIGYVALFASVAAYVCWNRAVAQVGASRAGPFIHLMPLMAAGLAIVFLGERPAGYHLIGVALIAPGIALASAPEAWIARLRGRRSPSA